MVSRDEFYNRKLGRTEMNFETQKHLNQVSQFGKDVAMIDENQLLERRTAPTNSMTEDISDFASIPYEKMTHEQRVKKMDEAQEKLDGVDMDQPMDYQPNWFTK